MERKQKEPYSEKGSSTSGDERKLDVHPSSALTPQSVDAKESKDSIIDMTKITAEEYKQLPAEQRFKYMITVFFYNDSSTSPTLRRIRIVDPLCSDYQEHVKKYMAMQPDDYFKVYCPKNIPSDQWPKGGSQQIKESNNVYLNKGQTFSIS